VCKRSCTPSGHDRGSGEQPRQLDGGNKSDRGTLNHILCQAKCMLWLATMSSMGAFTAHCATWSPVNVVQKGKGMLQSVPVMWSLVCGVRWQRCPKCQPEPNYVEMIIWQSRARMLSSLSTSVFGTLVNMDTMDCHVQLIDSSVCTNSVEFFLLCGEHSTMWADVWTASR
jgi:hypothetical protein